MAKKIILILLGVILLAIGGTATYVATADWNSYKSEIAGIFSDITGKKIIFSGPISGKLLPQPSLDAKDVKIVNPNNETEILASVDNMTAQVSLISILKGEPDVRSLSLAGAEIWMKISAENGWNWKSPAISLDMAPKSKTRLQSFSVQNALVHFANENWDFAVDLAQFNADIQADSLNGPFRLDGNFVKDDEHFGLAISGGDFSSLTDVALNFAITHPKSESYLRFDGSVLPSDDTYKGDFSGNAKKTADFANILAGMTVLENEYNVPLQFSVAVEKDKENINLSSFVIKYDNFVEGAGSLNIPLFVGENQKRNIDLKYQLISIDLRPLMSILKAEYKNFKDNGSVYAPNTDFNVMAEVEAEKIVFNDNDADALEDVKFKGTWIDNAFTLDEFDAICPGNMILNMTGSFVEEKRIPQYFLHVSLDGENLLTFLNAIGLDIKEYTQLTYRNVSLEFSLGGNNSAVSVSDLQLAMDKMNITGAIGVVFENGGNSYDVQLKTDTVIFDNYFPKPEGQNIIERLKDDIRKLSFLKWINLKLRLRADSVILRSVMAKDAVLVLNSQDGSLDIVELSAKDALSTDFRLGAKISKWGDIEMNFDDINFDVNSSNMSEVINKLAVPLPNIDLFKAKNFQTKGSYNGNFHEGLLVADVMADGNRIGYNGKIIDEREFTFDGKLEVKTTDVGDFIRDIGGNLSIGSNNRGALNCRGDIKGNTLAWNFDNTTCVWGISNYQGLGSVSDSASERTVNAQVKVDRLNVENLMSVKAAPNVRSMRRMREDTFMARPDFSKDVFIFDEYKNVVMDIKIVADEAIYKDKSFNDVSLHILNTNNVMQFNDISVKYKGVDVVGNVSVDYSNTPDVKGKLRAQNINLAGWGGDIYQFVKGNMLLEADFETTAVSIDEFVNNYTGSLNFSISDASLSGFDFAEIVLDLKERKYSKGLFQQIRDNLQSGVTDFVTFSGKITAMHGDLKFDDFVMQNEQANINVSGNVDINEWKMDNVFNVSLPQLVEMPSFSFIMSGLINKPVLDINIEDIVQKYDAHWEEIAIIEQTKKAEADRILNEKMAEAQLLVEQVSADCNDLISTIDKRLQYSIDDIYVSWYKSSLEILNGINKDIDAMKGKAHIPGFTEADVTEIENKCKQYIQKIEQLYNEVQERYVQDVDKRYEAVSMQGNSFEGDVVEFYKTYQQMILDNVNKLESPEAKKVVMENNGLKELEKKMNDLREKTAKSCQEFSQKVEDGKSLNNDLPTFELFIVSLQRDIQQMSADIEKLEDIYRSTDELLANEVVKQQQIFEAEKAEQLALQKAKAEEEAKNLLNEVKNNQPNLSSLGGFKNNPVSVKSNIAVKSGNVGEKTLQSYIAEPKVEEKILLQNVVKTNEDSSVKGVIRKSYEEKVVEKKAKTGLLRAVDGAIQKTSGTITVK